MLDIRFLEAISILVLVVLILFNITSAVFQLPTMTAEVLNVYELNSEQYRVCVKYGSVYYGRQCTSVHFGQLFGKVLAHRVSMPQTKIPIPEFIILAPVEQVNICPTNAECQAR